MQYFIPTFPAVSVIIPHFRRCELLESCLDSLRRTLYPNFSVLVVDNGAEQSDIGTIDEHYPEVQVLRLARNAGYAGGCNEGLRHSFSDYVVFLNDDTVVEPDWLGILVDAARGDRRLGALQPKILSLRARREGKRVFDYAGAAGGLIDLLGYPRCLGRNIFGVEEDHGQYDRPLRIFWASGVALFAPRNVVEQLGGFDEDFFMHMEEIDLCWRMQRHGCHIRSVPASVVWHEGGATLHAGSPMKIYYNHRNNIAMLLKNQRIFVLMLVLPARLLLELAAAIFYLLSRRDGPAKAMQVIRAATDNLRNFRRTLSKRKLGSGLVF